MNYSTNKLATVADCDKATALASERKSDLQFEQTISTREMTELQKTAALTNASLIGVNAEITGTQTAIAALEDGDEKTGFISKLRRLNDRKENLEERLTKGGAAAVLDTELDGGLLESQITEIDGYLAAIVTRRAAL